MAREDYEDYGYRQDELTPKGLYGLQPNRGRIKGAAGLPSMISASPPTIRETVASYTGGIKQPQPQPLSTTPTTPSIPTSFSAMPTEQPSQPSAGMSMGRGFVDFWNKMPPDRKQALGQGLFTTGAYMMAKGGQYSPLPVSTAGVLGESLLAGQQAYASAESEQAKRATERYKEGLALQKETRTEEREKQKLGFEERKVAVQEKGLGVYKNETELLQRAAEGDPKALKALELQRGQQRDRDELTRQLNLDKLAKDRTANQLGAIAKDPITGEYNLPKGITQEQWNNTIERNRNLIIREYGTPQERQSMGNELLNTAGLDLARSEGQRMTPIQDATTLPKF